MRRVRWLPAALLLLGYVAFILVFAQATFEGDEARYPRLAGNLTQGFYSPPDTLYLPNAPGYPILLMPVVALGLPLLVGKLLNAGLLLGAVLHVHRTAARFCDRRAALAAAAFVAVYGPFLRYAHMLLPETLAVFLLAGFVDHATAAPRDDARLRRRHVVIAALYLAGLALTKGFFGYVIVTNIAVLGALALRRPRLRAALGSHVLALALCVPYLAHTQRLTGRLFYWQTTGGSNLYWMTALDDEEYGDWQAEADSYFDQHRWDRPDCAERMRVRHRAFLTEVEKLARPERDARFRRQALGNIASRPGKYARNWLLNLSRMLWNYPFTCGAQTPRTLLYLVWDGPLALFLAIATGATLLRRVRVPQSFGPVLLFAFVGLGGTSLIAAAHRQFAPFVPLLAVWLAVVFGQLVLGPRPADGPPG